MGRKLGDFVAALDEDGTTLGEDLTLLASDFSTSSPRPTLQYGESLSSKGCGRLAGLLPSSTVFFFGVGFNLLFGVVAGLAATDLPDELFFPGADGPKNG